MTRSLTTIHRVPYFSQWESPELVAEFVTGARRAADDPLWPRSGAATASEYEFWARRLCAMACLRMALQHWQGAAPPSVSLANECVRAAAYVRHPDRVDGLIYAPFAAYARQRWGLYAEPRPDLPAARIASQVSAGRLLMLSVHPCIRTLDPQPPSKGGHLVLAVGTTADTVVIHNPSGLPGASQEFAHISWPDLGRFYAGRGIVLGEMP
jgi:hypothetical protein